MRYSKAGIAIGKRVLQLGICIAAEGALALTEKLIKEQSRENWKQFKDGSQKLANTTRSLTKEIIEDETEWDDTDDFEYL